MSLNLFILAGALFALSFRLSGTDTGAVASLAGVVTLLCGLYA